MKTLLLALCLLVAPSAHAAAAKKPDPVPVKRETVLGLRADFPKKTSGSIKLTKKGKDQTMTFDVPSTDVWDWYRGTFATATEQSAPRTLELVAQRVQDDVQRLGRIGGGESTRAQAEQSIKWLNEVLVPYAKRWQSLGR